MSEAVGYTRLSQSSDLSIDRQKTHIRDLAEEHGYNLDKIINDGERTSGFDSDREGYQRVRSRVQGGDIDAVIVNDKTRLARDYDDMMRLILDVREHDVAIHTYRTGTLDVSQPTHAAIEVLKAASEHEAKQANIEASIEATRERIESGYDHGRPPYGLQFDDNGQYWVPDPDTFETVLTAYEMRYEGEPATLETISDEIGVSVTSASRMFNTNRRRKYLDIAEQHGYDADDLLGEDDEPGGMATD